jgi:5-methylphenazine-1-carboxylate 1-monooxygenase
MNVIVVGAGIGGLTTALALGKRGIECVVYEKSVEVGEVGVGLNLLPPAVEVLAGLGLRDQLEQAGIRTGELVYANYWGQPIYRERCGGEYPQISIHRARLQRVLLDAVRAELGADAVRTGHRLITFATGGRGVVAYFVDPDGKPLPRVRGDVLIGADGIRSEVRHQLYPHEGRPIGNGVTMWRGATSSRVRLGTSEEMRGRSMLVAGGKRARLVVYPIGAGESPGTELWNWVLCVRNRPPGRLPEHQGWRRRAEFGEIEQYVNLFSIPKLAHGALLKSTQDIYAYPMCDRDPLPSWTHGPVALLGDAAHAVYPFGSRGAGEAIQDAHRIAHHLSYHLAQHQFAPDEALRAYERDRLEPTTRLIRHIREGGREAVLDVVDALAPQGFDRVEDVISTKTVDDLVHGRIRPPDAVRITEAARSAEVTGSRGTSTGPRHALRPSHGPSLGPGVRPALPAGPTGVGDPRPSSAEPPNSASGPVTPASRETSRETGGETDWGDQLAGSAGQLHVPEQQAGTPTLAGAYNHATGGAMNTASERALVERVCRVLPDYLHSAAANRYFHESAVRRFVGEERVTQLLDLGCGTFFDQSTHQIAQGVNGVARVVYVDTDPKVVAHYGTSTVTDDRVGVVRADLCDVDAVLNAAVTRRVLDLTQPVGVLATAVLHCVPDTDTVRDVRTVMRRYHDALPGGSMLAVSHATAEFNDAVSEAAAMFAEEGITVVPRTRGEFGNLLRPWRLITGVERLQWPLKPEEANTSAFTAIGVSIR